MRKHPLDHPFAWVLVQLDGADTSMRPRPRRAGADARRHRHARAASAGPTSGAGTSPTSPASSRRRARERQRADGEDDDGPVRFMQQHIALDYVVRVSPLAQRFGEQLRSRADRRATVPGVRPRVRAAAGVLPDVRRRHGPRGDEVELADTGTVTVVHGAHADPVPRPEGAGGLRAGQHPARRRRRHDRPAAPHRRAPRPDPHGHARRGGVGADGGASERAAATGATASATPSRGWRPTGEPDVPAEAFEEHVL